jgi:hypothetical protein
MRVGIARAGSALDEARPASLADQAAPSGAQPALDDVGHFAPFEPEPAAARGAPLPLPLPPPVESWPSPEPFVVPDRDAPPRPERRERSATTKLRGLLAAASPRRRVLWIGGAAGGVVLVVALVLVGGRKSDAVATSARDEDHAQGAAASTRVAVTAPVEPVSPAPPPAAPDASAVPAPSAPEKPPQPSVAATRPDQRPVQKLGNKKLVVEYTGQESEVAAPGRAAHAAEDPAIGRARRAYVSGNQKLFAGDAEGAIRAYRQALGFYPGYVGGYRGLGLAYAQLGNVPRALDAFKTYVSVVPGAKDIALIKKRIARLSGQ